MERVDQPMAAAALGPHDEMTREPHAHGLEPGPGRDRHVHDRERDRDAEPAVEHVVEEAVARIVVVLGVAPEAFFLEQEPGHGRRRVVDVHLGVIRSAARYPSASSRASHAWTSRPGWASAAIQRAPSASERASAVPASATSRLRGSTTAKLSGSPVTAPGGTGGGEEGGEKPRLEERPGRHEVTEDAHETRQVARPGGEESRDGDRERAAGDDALEDDGQPRLGGELRRAPGMARLQGGGGDVARLHGPRSHLRRDLGRAEGGVDALAREGIEEAGGISGQKHAVHAGRGNPIAERAQCADGPDAPRVPEPLAESREALA